MCLSPEANPQGAVNNLDLHVGEVKYQLAWRGLLLPQCRHFCLVWARDRATTCPSPLHWRRLTTTCQLKCPKQTAPITPIRAHTACIGHSRHMTGALVPPAWPRVLARSRSTLERGVCPFSQFHQPIPSPAHTQKQQVECTLGWSSHERLHPMACRKGGCEWHQYGPSYGACWRIAVGSLPDTPWWPM